MDEWAELDEESSDDDEPANSPSPQPTSVGVGAGVVKKTGFSILDLSDSEPEEESTAAPKVDDLSHACLSLSLALALALSLSLSLSLSFNLSPSLFFSGTERPLSVSNVTISAGLPQLVRVIFEALAAYVRFWGWFVRVWQTQPGQTREPTAL